MVEEAKSCGIASCDLAPLDGPPLCFNLVTFLGPSTPFRGLRALERTLRFNHEKSVVIVGAVGVLRNWRVGTFGLQYDLVAN